MGNFPQGVLFTMLCFKPASLRFARFSPAFQMSALCLALLLPAVSLPARAQGRLHKETTANRQRRIAATMQDTYTHRYDIFVGGSYLRFRTGDTLRRSNLAGFDIMGTRWLNPGLGITAEIRGQYGNAHAPNNPYNVYNSLISEYNFMAGPEFRLYRTEHLAASIHVLAGDADGNFSGGTKGLPSTVLGIYPDGNTISVSPGANLEVNVFPNLAWRIHPGYVYTRFGSSNQLNWGVSTGIVYRFGRQ